MNTAPPLWLALLAPLVSRLPVGRYRLANALPRSAPPFVATLPGDLGRWRFYCDLRDEIAREVCFTGRYEPQETQLAARLVRTGDTVIDVGANWGYFTLAASHWVGASGRVVALEPEPRLFAQLEANLALNTLSRVTARRLAAGDRSGSLAFVSYREQDGNRGISRRAAPGEPSDFTSAVAPLDDLLHGLAIERVRLAKIDVEGAEHEVLLGMRSALRAHRIDYVLLECHPGLLASRGLSMAHCVEPLVTAGYRLLEIDQSPDTYRRAARRTIPVRDLLRPFDVTAVPGRWPHLLALSPSAPPVEHG